MWSLEHHIQVIDVLDAGNPLAEKTVLLLFFLSLSLSLPFDNLLNMIEILKYCQICVSKSKDNLIARVYYTLSKSSQAVTAFLWL